VRALVTGAAGFIGSHLAERLLAEGADVVGVDCFTDYYGRGQKEANLEPLRAESGFQFLEADLADTNLGALLRDITHVFHLAAQAGVRRSWGRDFPIYTTANLDATQALLEACREKPIERFVYASSSSVYGDHVALPMCEDALPRPVSPYGVTKLAGEHLSLLYHHNHDVPAVALRYFTVYGPRQRPDMAFHRFLKAALRGDPIELYGDGNQTRDFTFVTDAVTATAAAAVRGVPGRVYNIAGGSRVSINAVLSLVEQCAGRPLDVRRHDSQLGDMRDTYADSSLARRDLGFTPAVALEEGLRAELAWLSAQPALTS